MLNNKICVVPFRYVEFWGEPGFGIVPCCTAWMNGDVTYLGNWLEEDLWSIWNSDKAKRLRQSVTDGTFKYCTQCPFLMDQSNQSSVIDRNDPNIPDYVKNAINSPLSDIQYLPEFIKITTDSSCNLHCPSCREGIILERDKKKIAYLEGLHSNKIAPFLANTKKLTLMGDGELFVSKPGMSLIKRLPDFIQDLTETEITILTNGILFTPSKWNQMESIHSARINVNLSADGISQKSFELTRRGGRYNFFIKNLEFISSLRRSKKIETLRLMFTVQLDNYSELPLIEQWAQKYLIDQVVLFQISHFYRTKKEWFEHADIFNTEHQRHKDFVETVKNLKLSTNIIRLGRLSQYR